MIHVGKEGVTDAAVRSAREALNTRELLKVRILEAAPASTRETAASLAEEIDDAQVVQVIGRTAVLYRPDPDDPSIKLP